MTDPMKAAVQPSMPMTLNDLLVLGGDVLVLIGIAVAAVVYRRQKSDGVMRDVTSTLADLQAIRSGVTKWGDLYFTTDYSNDEITEPRAQRDYAAVMAGSSPGQIFRVPTEPLASLIQRSETSPLITSQTMQAVNDALWCIGKFNQFVQQQTDYFACHMNELADLELPEQRRIALAEGARWISIMIHRWTIGNAGWSPRVNYIRVVIGVGVLGPGPMV
jgi:hypothetical protein